MMLQDSKSCAGKHEFEIRGEGGLQTPKHRLNEDQNSV